MLTSMSKAQLLWGQPPTSTTTAKTTATTLTPTNFSTTKYTLLLRVLLLLLLSNPRVLPRQVGQAMVSYVLLPMVRPLSALRTGMEADRK